MKWSIIDGAEFAVCEFCGIDASNIKVSPIGDKGICKECLRSLALLINAEIFEWNSQLTESTRISRSKGVHP